MAKRKLYQAEPEQAPEWPATQQEAAETITHLLNRIKDIRDRTHWVGNAQTGSDYTLGYIGAMCDETLAKFSPIGSEEEIPF